MRTKIVFFLLHSLIAFTPHQPYSRFAMKRHLYHLCTGATTTYRILNTFNTRKLLHHNDDCIRSSTVTREVKNRLSQLFNLNTAASSKQVIIITNQQVTVNSIISGICHWCHLLIGQPAVVQRKSKFPTCTMPDPMLFAQTNNITSSTA